MKDPIQVARALLGVPWRHQGRNPNIGIDCAGLLLLAFDVQSPTPTYGREPRNGLLEATMEGLLGTPLPGADDLRPGDAVAMAYAGPIRHCGLIADDIHGGLSLIHTDSILGRVTEHPLDEKWLRRIRRVYRRGGA